MGVKLLDTGLGNDFLDMTPKAQTRRIKSTNEITSNLKCSVIAKESNSAGKPE